MWGHILIPPGDALDEHLDERKMWVSETAQGVRATCSDCAWNYPVSGWGARGPAVNEVHQVFDAHKCSDNPRSRPRNPAAQDRRVRVEMDPQLGDRLRSNG